MDYFKAMSMVESCRAELNVALESLQVISVRIFPATLSYHNYTTVSKCTWTLLAHTRTCTWTLLVHTRTSFSVVRRTTSSSMFLSRSLPLFVPLAIPITLTISVFPHITLLRVCTSLDKTQHDYNVTIPGWQHLRSKVVTKIRNLTEANSNKYLCAAEVV